MNSAIVEEGSVASGDGCSSYAARRRNLACRSLALGRSTAHTKACRSRRLISLPIYGPKPPSRSLFIALTPEFTPPGDQQRLLNALTALAKARRRRDGP